MYRGTDTKFWHILYFLFWKQYLSNSLVCCFYKMNYLFWNPNWNTSYNSHIYFSTFYCFSSPNSSKSCKSWTITYELNAAVYSEQRVPVKNSGSKCLWIIESNGTPSKVQPPKVRPSKVQWQKILSEKVMGERSGDKRSGSLVAKHPT